MTVVSLRSSQQWTNPNISFQCASTRTKCNKCLFAFVLFKQTVRYLALLLYCAVLLSVYRSTNLRTFHNVQTRYLDHARNLEYNFGVHKPKYTLLLGTSVKYIHIPHEFCSPESKEDGQTSLVLLVLVHSAVRNRAQRDAIRNTWARFTRRLTGGSAAVVFLVGSDDDRSLMERVLNEANAYKDLIVTDMMDTYRNLSLKSLSGLHWVHTFCSEVPFVLKTDDDVYVDLENVLRILPGCKVTHLASDGKKAGRYLNRNSSRKAVSLPAFGDHGLVGSVNTKAHVMRRGLWGIEYALHPAELYPDYCSGNVYLMKANVVSPLLTASRSVYYGNLSFGFDRAEAVPFVPFEDVFITGYLAGHIGLTCHKHPGFPHWATGPSQRHIESIMKGRLLAVHNVYYDKMYDIHKTILNNK